MSKSLLQQFIDGEIGIRLRTPEEWHNLMLLVTSKTKLTWADNATPTGFNVWNFAGDTSTIGVKDGNQLIFGNVHEFKETDHEVIEFQSLWFEESSE